MWRNPSLYSKTWQKWKVILRFLTRSSTSWKGFSSPCIAVVDPVMVNKMKFSLRPFALCLFSVFALPELKQRKLNLQWSPVYVTQWDPTLILDFRRLILLQEVIVGQYPWVLASALRCGYLERFPLASSRGFRRSGPCPRSLEQGENTECGSRITTWRKVHCAWPTSKKGTKHTCSRTRPAQPHTHSRPTVYCMTSPQSEMLFHVYGLEFCHGPLNILGSFPVALWIRIRKCVEQQH